MDFSLDPLTVVSRGAAIFAGTQRVKAAATSFAQSGRYALELDYQPVDYKSEPLVGGKIQGRTGEEFSGWTIEFSDPDARPEWRSGKISLSSDGLFLTTLRAEKGRRNTYLIELCDSRGFHHETSPDRLTYTIGATVTEQTLTHSVGIALAINEPLIFFKKGTPLPARARKTVRSVYPLRAGESGRMLIVPVIEGEQSVADRNQLIGRLEISGRNVRRDLPAGTEIEVEIIFDESRLGRVKCYVPLLDEEFDEFKLHAEYEELNSAELHGG